MSKESKPQTKNLFQRMLGVMEDVKYVQKESKRVNGQYTFVSHDAVSRAMHDPLIKHGIVMIPTVDEMRQEGNRTVAVVSVSFINVDDPLDLVAVTYTGYGIDTQDKGPGKAISYATKYAMLKVFCLESGDDPERDNIEYVEEKISHDEIVFLEELIDDDVVMTNRILRYANVKNLKDISKEKYKEILEGIKKTKRGDK